MRAEIKLVTHHCQRKDKKQYFLFVTLLTFSCFCIPTHYHVYSKTKPSFLDDRYPQDKKRGGRRRRRTREKKREGRDTARDRKSLWVQERWIERERQRERRRVSQCCNQPSRQPSHLYCQSPLPPVTRGLNETRPSRSSMLFSVSSSSTITLHLFNRHQTFSHGAHGDWRAGWGPKGCWLPGDHVSTDLHYSTIKCLVSSSKVREHLSSPPSIHSCFPYLLFLNTIPLLLIKTSHPFSEVYFDILCSVLLLFDSGDYFQGLLEAKRTGRG